MSNCPWNRVTSKSSMPIIFNVRPRRRPILHFSEQRGVVMPILLIMTIVCAAASAFCWFLFFTLYWPNRHRFNEQGRYVAEDGEVVLHEQSAALLAPGIAFLLLALLFAWLLVLRRRRRDRDRDRGESA